MVPRLNLRYTVATNTSYYGYMILERELCTSRLVARHNILGVFELRPGLDEDLTNLVTPYYQHKTLAHSAVYPALPKTTQKLHSSDHQIYCHMN